jgi:hypothetical protein
MLEASTQKIDLRGLAADPPLQLSSTCDTRGREFFEEIIRDNLDMGRPDRVQLVFDRVVTKKTPGMFRTRVIQDGVHPSLHIEYKNFDLKQYF